MSSNMFKLGKLFSQIKEAFDFENIQAIDTKKVTNTKYKSIDGSLEVQFDVITELDIIDGIINIPRNIENVKSAFNVSYSVNEVDDQSYKTDYNEFISILKGVKQSIEDFIESNQPDLLILVSRHREGGFRTDPSKDKLYKHAILKNLPNGYNAEFDFEPFYGSDLKGIVLYKKSLKNVRVKHNL